MTENKVGKGLVISLGEQMVTLRSQLKHIEFPSPVLALGQFRGPLAMLCAHGIASSPREKHRMLSWALVGMDFCLGEGGVQLSHPYFLYLVKVCSSSVFLVKGAG